MAAVRRALAADTAATGDGRGSFEEGQERTGLGPHLATQAGSVSQQPQARGGENRTG